MWRKLANDHFESVASVILRVPGLFVLDHWWVHEKSNLWPSEMDWTSSLAAVITNLILAQGLLILLLPLERLVDLYMHYISAGLLTIAHLFSTHYVVTEQLQHKTEDKLEHNIAALTVHLLLASVAGYLLDVHNNIQRMILGMYTLPVVCRIANVPLVYLHHAHSIASMGMLIQAIYYVLKYIPGLLEYIRASYFRMLLIAEVYGWLYVLLTIWNALMIPSHFLWFWLIQFTSQIYHFVNASGVYFLSDEWYLVLLAAVSEICNSPISLLSTAVTIAYISYCALTLTKCYLLGCNSAADNVIHSGWTEGITMIFLAVQTSLIHLKMPQRTAVMTIILFIIISSLMQSMFEITEPVLLSLSASHNKSITKHVRTLFLCFFLCVFPLYLTFMMFLVFHVDFWMLVVICSCVMTSVQVLGLLVVYGLFIYDARHSEPWEALDDLVYYTRATTRVLEFLVAVFVVGAGLRESVVGQWSWVNSSVLIIHCYFNVWQRLQSGWKSYLLRREAVKKIASLHMATEQEIINYNDVCAICYSDLKLAVVTPCNHYYHPMCLRKWLYVQDKCPMCHAVIHKPEETPNASTSPEGASPPQPQPPQAEDIFPPI